MNTNENILVLCAEGTEEKKPTINFGYIYLGILLMEATGIHDVPKALGNHSLTGLNSYVRKNLTEKNPEEMKKLILQYLATDPEAEAKAKAEAEEARKKAKAEREVKKAEKAKAREAEIAEFFSWNS